MNGALNNAALAFELALGAPPPAEATLRAGLSAVQKASRAAMLLACLVTGKSRTGEDADLYMNDVREMLREHARATGRALPSEFHAHNGPVAGTAEAMELMLAELARMDGDRPL